MSTRNWLWGYLKVIRNGSKLEIILFSWMISLSASRWPWQKAHGHWSHTDSWYKKNKGRWGWGPVPGMGRFGGGGWQWELGFRMGANTATVVFNLLFGSVRISIKKLGA